MIFQVVIAALCAALLIVFLSWLHKKGKISRRLAALCGFILLFAGNMTYFGVIAPQHQRQAKLAATEKRLADMPAFRTIKVQQPELFQQLQQEFNAALQEGMNEQQALEVLRPALSDLINQRISYVSNAQLHSFMQISLEEMKLIRQKSAQLCYRFLFPQINGGINTSEVLPQALRDREMAALDTFLMQSRGAKQPMDIARSRADLQALVGTLYGKWGSDLQTLNSPAEAGVDKSKLCDMTIDLYQSVLALPVNQSAGVLRIILDASAD
ncbi:hypothetical protein AAGQ96_15230 [Pantoea sp. MBD-2R]|uniref:hypothetical protein n=1 Tax=unclassified Pantoea TaxID=2630326 RepID=UPI0011BD4880|nr:hypothetical protein [Pantoea sp. CCBC3-3-1]